MFSWFRASPCRVLIFLSVHRDPGFLQRCTSCVFVAFEIYMVYNVFCDIYLFFGIYVLSTTSNPVICFTLLAVLCTVGVVVRLFRCCCLFVFFVERYLGIYVFYRFAWLHSCIWFLHRAPPPPPRSFTHSNTTV